MKLFKFISILLLVLLACPVALGSFKLNIKIDQMVGRKTIAINKTIQAEFNKEINIEPAGFKNKVILNLKKIQNVLVNGEEISPIQVDMKVVNELQDIIGSPQTITSFYNRTAQFAIRSSGLLSDKPDINVTLNFEETN